MYHVPRYWFDSSWKLADKVYNFIPYHQTYKYQQQQKQQQQAAEKLRNRYNKQKTNSIQVIQHSTH